MNKTLVLLLAMILTLSMMIPAMASQEPYKIAIITGTTTQGEEEYRAAEKLKEQYPGIVVTDTYPDKFAAEVETTIGKILAFAADPQVKAIIMVQAVQGATAAFTQIKTEMKRDDILLMAGVPAEDPQSITSAADVVMGVDEINGGAQIVETANEWGAEVLIHYSFARHMGYETIVARYNIMKDEAARAGIELVQRDAPDPTGDAGMVGAQNFILEDVPKVMQEYAGESHVNSYGLTDIDAVLEAYGNRGYRLAQFEAALYGSRLHLGTHAVGLGAVGSTSFDDEVVEFLTPGREQMAYLFVFVFGKRRRKVAS